MKIQRIETYCREEVGFVRVVTDDGAQGWGQVSTYHPDISALILHRQVAPWVRLRPGVEPNSAMDRTRFGWWIASCWAM